MSKSIREKASGDPFLLGLDGPEKKNGKPKLEKTTTDKSGVDPFMLGVEVKKKETTSQEPPTISDQNVTDLQNGTEPTSPSESILSLKKPTDKARYVAIETSDAKSLVDDYKDKANKAAKSVTENPFDIQGGLQKYNDYLQSREAKTGKIISDIADQGKFNPDDINYLVKVAPAAATQLIANVLPESTPQNVLSPDNVKKFIDEGGKIVDRNVTEAKVKNNQYINKASDETLTKIGISPLNLQDSQYATQVNSGIIAQKDKELAELDKKYPQKAEYSDLAGVHYKRPDEAKYYPEKIAIQKKYDDIQNKIGLSTAFQYAKVHPTLTALEIGEQWLKYAQPDTYQLWLKSNKDDPINRDIAEIGVRALYASGNPVSIELAKSREKELDNKYPDKKISEVYHRLGAELYKDENWFFNAAPNVARLDKAAEQLSQEDRDFYYKFIRDREKKNIGTEVPMSGLINKAGEAIATNTIETTKFLGDVVGTRSNKDIAKDALNEGNSTQFQDVGTYNPAVQRLTELNNKQKKDKKLTPEEISEKQDLETFAGVRSTAQEVIDGTGNLTGQVLFQALATKGLGAVAGAGVKGVGLLKVAPVLEGLSTEEALAAQATSFGVSPVTVNAIGADAIAYASSYDSAKRDAFRLMPDDKDSGKRTIYATIVGGLNAATERIFKDEKVLNAFNKEISPNIKNLVEQLSAGEISQKAFAPEISNILKKSGAFLKEALKSNTEESLEEFASSVGTSVATAILAPTKFSYTQAYNDAVNSFTTTFVNGGLVAGLAGVNGYKANHIGIPTLAKLGIDENMTKEAKSFINAQVLSKNMTQEEANNKFRILNTAVKINTQVMPQVSSIATDLPQKAKEKYSVQLLNEKILTSQAEESKDPVLKAELEKRVKESEKIRKQILGKELLVDDDYSVKTPEQINQQSQAIEETKPGADVVQTETQLTDQIFNRANEKASEGIKRSLDENKKQESVQFLKDQSLDTPNALMNQLGNDEELTTDIIASNPKEEIQKSINKYETELKKEGNIDQRIEEIDKHLSLLDKGLIKADNLQIKTNQNGSEETAQEGQKANQATQKENSSEEGRQNGDGGVLNQIGAAETTTEAAPISVGELIDKPVIRNGQRGILTQDGQTVIFKPENSNREYELGNIDEIKGNSLKNYGIEQEKSVVSIEDEGKIIVRGKEYFNPFEERGQNPMDAILYDNNGNVVNVRMKTSEGERRTFTGNVAEDLAYQITLKEITKNNETREQFEQYINENPEISKEMEDGGLSEITTTEPVKDNEKVQRERIVPKPKETTSTEPIEKSKPKKEPELSKRKELSDKLRKLLGNEASAFSGDTNPLTRKSFDDLGLSKNDSVDQIIDKLINYGGEYSDIFRAIKNDTNLSNVRIELVDRLENGESGLYHPIGHGEGKDGLLQISNKGNVYYTAAHELLHFLTLDSSIAEQVKDSDSYKGIEDLYNYLSSNKEKPVAIAGNVTMQNYGLTNVKEFMAEMFINPTFRNYVSDVFAKNKDEIFKQSKILKDTKVNSIGDLISNFFKDLFTKLFSSKNSNIPYDEQKSVIDNAVKLATDLFFKGKDVTEGQVAGQEGGRTIEMGNQRAAALALPATENKSIINDFVKSSLDEGATEEDIKGALVDNGVSEEEAQKFIDDNKPPKPPVEEKKPSKEEFENKPKAILNNIFNSKNIPQYIKDRFENEGLKYNPQSHEVARQMASHIISEFGIEDSIAMAEAGRFDGDVNSMIFAEGIDKTFEREQAATTTEGKQRLAEQWADYALRYDEAARQKGKFISAVYDFYKKSPLGVVLAEKARRDDTFKEWFKKRNKDYKEVFDAIKEEPEFKAFVEEQVTEGMKEERAQVREKRRKKITDLFDNAKMKKDGLNASLIPPPVWNGAMEAMKQAALAGESLVNVIESGIAHIKENHKEAFNEDQLREQWKNDFKGIDEDKKSRLDQYKDNLRDQIYSLNEQINNKSREFKESKKTELDDEAKELIKQRDDLKKKLDEVAPLSSNQQWIEKNKERILDRFRKKLSGLTDKQKEDVIRKSFHQLVENGALEYDDFKKIVADVMGIGKLSDEEVKKINEYVKDINSVQDAADRALKDRSKKSIKDFEETSKRAEKSATALANIVHTKTDILQRVRSIIQLNTLGIVSLIKNPIYNIMYQGLVRLPKALIQTGLDQAIYGTSLLANKVFGSKVIKPDVNILLAQKGYFNQGAKGGAESVKQVFTGLTNQDYFQKEVRTSQLKPLQSWKDIWAWKKGEKFLSGAQVADKVIQGTVGIPAEAVARLLNIGDKPFRFAAEGAVASTIAAQEFGLKSGIDNELFVRFPKEEAKRLYMKQGLTEEEALKKAEAIEKRIVTEGEQSVFQQKNLVTEGLNGLGNMMKTFSEDKPIAKGGAALAKIFGTLNAPFLKTPLNIFWELFNLAAPEVALGQSAVYGFLAGREKYLGNHEKAAEYALQAKKWTAHAAVGYSLLSLTGYFASIGAISGSGDDDKEKERKGKKNYQRPNSLNVSKILRAFGGESKQDEDNDLMVDLSWFGAPGTIMQMQADRYENMSQEDKANSAYVGDLLPRMHETAAQGLENSIFQNTIAGLNAFHQGGRWVDSWMLSQINVGSNFFQPATMAQFSRATLPYNYTIKADSFGEEVKNNFAARSLLFRLASGYPPSDVTIWGDESKKNITGPKGVAFSMLGWDEYNKDAFAEPIFQDFKRTGNSSFFPTAVNPSMTVDGQSMKMNTEEERQYKILIGQARKSLIAPYVNDNARIESKDEDIDGKTYNELSDEQKIKALNILYKKGFDAGKAQFKQLHPQFQTQKEKEKEEE